MRKGLKIFIIAVTLPLMCLLAHRWSLVLASSETVVMVETMDTSNHSLPLEDECEYMDMRMMCPPLTVSLSSSQSKWNYGTAGENIYDLTLYSEHKPVHHSSPLRNHSSGRNLVNLLHRLLI